MTDLTQAFGQGEAHPLALFALLWQVAGAWSPALRASAVTPDSAFIARADECLASEDGEAACRDLCRLLGDAIDGGTPEGRGQAIATMSCIDRFFYRIHPRNTRVSAASRGTGGAVPKWLRDFRRNRELAGFYWQTDVEYVLPRGPLVRMPREQTASSADSLADRFATLSVVPKVFRHEARPVTLAFKHVPTDGINGISAGADHGSEIVGFYPVAEGPDDITWTRRFRGAGEFIDFRAHPDLDTTGRLLAALGMSGVVDIALASELVMDAAAAERIGAGLGAMGKPARLVVAGSGHAVEAVEGQHFNESHIFNGFGLELGRQRKVWPAGIKEDKANAIGLTPAEAGLLFEDNAAGAEILVIDADGLGRCIVLICQDIEMRSCTNDLVNYLQPDWVLVPILDVGVQDGKWAHRRAAELSTVSQARFLVAGSLTLARWAGTTPEPPCGMAIGPYQPAADETIAVPDLTRSVRFAHVEPGSSPGYAVIQWRQGKWDKTTVSATPPASKAKS